MSSNAPTLPPSPDANGDPLKTNLDLRQVVVDAVREVVRQEVTPRFQAIETELRKVNKKLDVLNQSILEIRADQRLLEDRIELLEKGSV